MHSTNAILLRNEVKEVPLMMLAWNNMVSYLKLAFFINYMVEKFSKHEDNHTHNHMMIKKITRKQNNNSMD